MMNTNEGIIRQAIESKKSISFYYQGYFREASPHCLGVMKQKRAVMLYQFGGNTSTGPISELTEKNWRTMFPAEMTDICMIEANWHSHSSYCGPGKRFDSVDVVVPY